MAIDPISLCTSFKTYGSIVLAIIALLLPLKNHHLRLLERGFNKIARQRRLAICLVGLLAFTGNLLIAYKYSFPIPVVQDEFSYLLAADTFAQGRITNPVHPMWIHFETFYVLQQPTYMSIYPPGQGFILAVGQILTGLPIVGVWLSVALMCSALCWMLQAWMPPRWALLGSLLVLLKIGLFSYWSQSFWGGAFSALGGCLVLGAFRYTLKKPNIKNSFLLGLGLLILANTRPYEGLLISLPAMFLLLFWLLRNNKFSFDIKLKQVFLPLAISALFIVVVIGYYNFSITGKVLQMPYLLYQQIYATVPNSLWSKPRLDVKYNHEIFRHMYYKSYINLYNSNLGLSNFFNLTIYKLSNLSIFFLGIPFSFFISALPLLIKNYWVRFSLLTLLLLLIGIVQILYNFPHYAAPSLCLIYFLLLQCMRKLYLWKRRSNPLGKLLVWSVPIYLILLTILPISLKLDPFLYNDRPSWDVPRTVFPPWTTLREKLISQLNQTEKHLILVVYSAEHESEIQWVNNEANIDNSKVVWAYSMGDEKDCELIKYFVDRKIWLLHVKNTIKGSLTPYTINSCK
ncbi:MAG: hypothetical protein J0M03_02070 [Acidobacteria bacterium]|nr:hypothetical protein [Acidobacteriota bacterium]